MTALGNGYGTVRRPGDPGFAAAALPFNTRYADVRPKAAVSVCTAADVSRVITRCREGGEHLVPRGGGHSYAGYSTGPGLVLDLRALDSIDIDAGTGLVTVGGGTDTGRLSVALQRAGLAIPLGNADGVGIGGLTLGGGVAAVSRKYGLTCDSLVRTDVVLADGTLVRADAQDNADLFWACRGAGGGQFGVHTSFTFQAFEPRPSATCLLLWEWRHARDVLAAMQAVMAAAPDEFAARIGAARGPGGPGQVSVIGQHLGPAAELREFLEPALAVAAPARCEIVDRTYWEARDFLHHETSGDPFAVRTRTTPVPLSEAGIDTVVAAVDRWPGSSNPDGAGVALFTWGGAVSRIPLADSAFGQRDTLFLVSMDTSWGRGESADVVWSNLEWLDEVYERMGAHATDGSYVNFTDPALATWRTAYHGANLDRLVDLKRRLDPDRFFDFPQAL